MFPIASRVVMVLVLAALSGPGCGQSAVAQDKDTDQIAFLGVLLKRLASPWTYTVLYERNQISIDGCGPDRPSNRLHLRSRSLVLVVQRSPAPSTVWLSRMRYRCLGPLPFMVVIE